MFLTTSLDLLFIKKKIKIMKGSPIEGPGYYIDVSEELININKEITVAAYIIFFSIPPIVVRILW